MLCLRGGAVFVLASAGQSPWLSSRGARLAVFRAVPCFEAPVVCAFVSQGGYLRSAWFRLVARRPLAWSGDSLAPPVVFAATSVLSSGALVFNPLGGHAHWCWCHLPPSTSCPWI